MQHILEKLSTKWHGHGKLRIIIIKLRDNMTSNLLYHASLLTNT